MRRLSSSAFVFFVLSPALAVVVSLQAQDRPAAPGRAPVELPDGPGKEEVTSTCAACHGLNMIAGATGYSHAGWRDLVATMVKLPAERETAVTQYLADPLPAQARPRAGARRRRRVGHLPGMAGADARPAVARSAPAARRHDLVERPVHQPDRPPQSDHRRDEGIQARPRRPSRTASSTTPHGNIWYLGNGNGTIGKFVPATGEITVFKMPDPAARDPHTGDLRQGRHAVLHAAAEQHARPAGALDRRDQARHADDAARRCPTASSRTRRATSGWPTTAPARSAAWTR